MLCAQKWDTFIPSFSCMFKHPVVAGHHNPAPLCILCFSIGEKRNTGEVGVVDLTRTMPCDVLISVVWLAWRRKPIFWNGQLALNIPTFPSLLCIIVVDHFLASNDDFRAKFTKDGSCGDDTDRAAFVRVGYQVSFN